MRYLDNYWLTGPSKIKVRTCTHSSFKFDLDRQILADINFDHQICQGNFAKPPIELSKYVQSNVCLQ